MTPSLWVAGVPVGTVCPVGDLQVDVRWPFGSYALSAELLLRRKQRPKFIARDAPAELRVGAVPVWAGSVAEVSWADGTVTCSGAARDAETADALAADGKTTSSPDTAVDVAIARGALPGWSRPASVHAAALAAVETARVHKVAALLDAASPVTGKRWTVDPHRRLLAAADPTTPRFFILPGVGELDWATERYASRINARYADAAAGGALKTISVGTGSIEQAVDLTKRRGPISTATATTIVTNILRDSLQGGWANGIEFAYGDVVDAGGNRVPLHTVAAAVGAGAMFRNLGQPDPRPDATSLALDFVAGQALWEPVGATGGTVTVMPFGAADRDFDAIVSEQGGEVAA